MRWLLLIFGLAVIQGDAAVVLDRIGVVVGKHAIKASDVERDIRVTAFLNRVQPDLNAASRRKSADRLVDQALIRDEITKGDYSRASDSDMEGMLQQIRRDRFGSSDARLRDELVKYGLAEDELKEELLWQLTVLRFIEERFRPAVLVTEETVKVYYAQHITELKREYPRDSSFPTVQPKIQSLLEGQEVDKLFDAWLSDVRKGAHVEFREEAFR